MLDSLPRVRLTTREIRALLLMVPAYQPAPVTLAAFPWVAK